MSADSPAARVVAAYEQHTTTLRSRHTAEADHRASATVLEKAQCALPVYCVDAKSFTEGYNAGLADAVTIAPRGLTFEEFCNVLREALNATGPGQSVRIGAPTPAPAPFVVSGTAYRATAEGTE